MRIVSLLPSATEIVCSLGLEENLVGVTHECDYPPSVASLPKVTRTLIPSSASSAEIDRLVREQLQTTKALYSLDAPLLESLVPDLIVTQALCDVCAVAEAEVRGAACQLPNDPRVVNLEPMTLSQVLDSIEKVGEAAAVDPAIVREALRGLQTRIDAVAERSRSIERGPRVALLEWIDPPFCSGHWSPELVRLAGGVDGVGLEGQTSRTLSWDEVMKWRPEVVFIACCGFDVARTMEDVPGLCSVPGWAELPAVKDGRVYVTDGSQYFNRPGPRLVDSLEILAHALHPDVHPLPEGIPPAVRVSTDIYNLTERTSHG